MTRKKSNVKALALAVTCAILAGGYSSLNPVYAADDYTVKYDATENCLDYVKQNSAGGYNTYGISKIKLNNIVLDSSIGTSPSITVGSYFSIDGSGGSINAANGKFTVSGAGAITATSLKLGSDYDVKEKIDKNKGDIGTINGDIQTIKNNNSALEGKVNTHDADISGLKTTVGDANSGLVKKTTNISYDASSNTTTVNGIKFHTDTSSGISDINDGIIKFSKNGTKDIVQINSDLMFNDDATGQAATLTLEGVKTLNGLSNGGSVIQAGDGSVVGGVKFDNKDITNINNATVDNILKVKTIQSINGNNAITVEEMATTKYNTDKISYDANDGTTIDGNVMVNKGDQNQVKITDEGIVVGLTSAVINGDGFYAGGHDYGSAKAAIDGKDGKIKGAGGKFGVDDQGNVTTTGDIKGKDVTVDGKLSANGDAVVGGDLSVTGKANFTQEATFAGGITTDAINEATPDKGVTIDGVWLKDQGISAAGGKFTVDGATGNVKTAGDIEGQNITANGALKGASLDVTNDAAVGGKLDVTGDTTLKGKLDLTGDATFGGDLTVAKKITGQSLNIGVTGNEFTVDTVGHMTSKSAQIGLVGINNTGVITGVTSLTTDALHVTGAFTTGSNLTVTGDLEASGAIKGKTISISDSGSIAGVSFATGGNLTATTGTIAGVSFATGGVVSGVSDFTSTIIRDGAGTIITNGNVESKTAKIGAISIDNEKIEGSSANGLTIENVKIKDGVVSDVTSLTADKATIGGVNTLDNTGIKVATGSKIQVGAKTVIEDGSIAVSTNTKLTDQALNLNATNTWTAAGGLVADKATVNGVVLGADATQGKATFTDAAGKVTTIAGDTITTGTITAGELLVDSISLGKDPANKNITIGSNGDIKTNGDITVTGTGGDTTVIDGAQATFGQDAMNQTIINKGDISATAKNAADAQQSTLTHNNKGFKVAGKDASGTKASSFGFDTSTGIGTFTGQDSTTTAINGSNLTLTNGANSTALTAGGATFTGAAGDSSLHGTETKIDGGIITTDTLNVERINLGENILDTNGTPHGSNLSMDKQGNFSAAGGNFKVTGGTGADKGAFTNTVGNTTLQTDTNGASMKYNNGTVESNVSVGDNSAMISAGASSIEVKNDGITNNGKTTFKGAVDATVPTTETTINGNTITTGHLITDRLTITGSGAAAGAGTGTIALGGDGSITSNIKDAATGKEATFKTNAEGTFTHAKDGANETTNTVNAQGNTNVVTDGTNTSTATQKATSIGGVVTNGTVTMKQELTADGVKFEQTGHDEVNIAKGDVTVKNNRNAATPGQEVHLSDLGSLNNLDGELAARDEYQDNETAVGAINAEAAIRREEVARLDNRIDDVNNRVDKVGAMAAAIASLKSIGYDPQAPSEFSIGIGQYKGETGVAMGFFHYPNKNFMINVSLSTAGGETMGGIGATWRFGHKSPQKLLEEQREAQARKELAAAEKYQAAAKLAKEAQERAEYAAKLARQAQVSADNAKAAADATQAKHF